MQIAVFVLIKCRLPQKKIEMHVSSFIPRRKATFKHRFALLKLLKNYFM